MELAILLSVILLAMLVLTDVEFLLSVLVAACVSTFVLFVLINIIGSVIRKIKHKRRKLIVSPNKLFKRSGRHWFLSLMMFVMGITVLLLDISAIVSQNEKGVTKIVLIVLMSFCAFEWIYHAFVKVPKRSFNVKSNNLKSMTGIEFENYCAKILSKKGYKKISVTPASGDYGADIVAFDKHGNKWVIQCKKYKSKVGNSAVQEVIAAKAYYGASKAMVMTNSVLTDNAKQLARVNKVELWEMVT